MKTILVLNNSANSSNNAAVLALSLAQHTGAHLLLANMNPIAHTREYNLVTVNRAGIFAARPETGLQNMLIRLNEKANAFKPDISVLPGTAPTTAELAAIINSENISMVVSEVSGQDVSTKPNLQAILNKITCPLLLVPQNFCKTRFEHMVYTTDLRYCKIEIVRYLAKLAGAYQSSLLIAHLSASGLPHLADTYAESIFSQDIYPRAKYAQLCYQNIKERDITKAADVLINGMHADLLVMENHRFHFEEIFGRYIPDQLPPLLTVPVLIFPY
jgi:hypothetical protein